MKWPAFLGTSQNLAYYTNIQNALGCSGNNNNGNASNSQSIWYTTQQCNYDTSHPTNGQSVQEYSYDSSGNLKSEGSGSSGWCTTMWLEFTGCNVSGWGVPAPVTPA